jgi:hypothetical protein
VTTRQGWMMLVHEGILTERESFMMSDNGV